MQGKGGRSGAGGRMWAQVTGAGSGQRVSLGERGHDGVMPGGAAGPAGQGPA